MIFRPDIKPPMWGAPDAVQYAVRHNAERMGITPAWMIPLLEGAGTVASDVVGFEVATLSGLGWDVSDQSLTGFTYSGAQSLILPSKDIYRLAGQSSVTLIVDVYLGSWANEFPHLWSVRNASTQVSVFGVGADISSDTPSNYRRPYIAQSTSNYGVSATNVVPVNARSTLAFSVGNGNVNFYLNGVNVGSSGGVGTFQPSTISPLIGNRVSGGRGLPNGKLYYVYAFHQQLSDPQIAQLHATPYALLMPVSRPVYFDLGAGGGTYTETLDTLITSISSITDRQAYRETVDTLITSGATVDAVTGMIEALLTLGQSASTATAVQGYVDGVSDTIISASDTADAQDYVDGPATTGVSASDETDTQAYTDSLADTLVSASDVTDTTGAPPLAESLLTTAISASNVSAAQAYVETVTALAVSASSLGEVLGLLEQLGTVGESISAVSDRQLYYDNVAIVAISSSSLAAVGAYVEQVAAAAVSASSLTDVLVGSFVGRYVFADYCRPRSFADYARPRSFEDYCRPKGRRLQ